MSLSTPDENMQSFHQCNQCPLSKKEQVGIKPDPPKFVVVPAVRAKVVGTGGNFATTTFNKVTTKGVTTVKSIVEHWLCLKRLLHLHQYEYVREESNAEILDDWYARYISVWRCKCGKEIIEKKVAFI